MKIGILGYGKMGKLIEHLALMHGDEIVWKISSQNLHDRQRETLRQAEVIIEFSRPESGFDNVMACLEAGVPVVSGTTGWQDKLPAAQQFCEKRGGAMLWASNFSVGVNLFFLLNEYLAQLMATCTAYDVSLREVHHIRKLDAPSGTAVTLAEGIFMHRKDKKAWVLLPKIPASHEIAIESVRRGDVPGTHEVMWKSANDTILIQHEAHNRIGFATGALLAARWLVGKKGAFSMRDVILESMLK